VVTLVKISLAQRVENTFVAYARYLAKTFWPSPLANPYPYPDHWDGLLIIYAVALIVGLCAVAGLQARRFPFAATGWFLVCRDAGSGDWAGPGGKPIHGRPVHLFAPDRDFHDCGLGPGCDVVQAGGCPNRSPAFWRSFF